VFDLFEGKAEHQRPSEQLEQPVIPEWKWERIAMYFITKLPRTQSDHDSVCVIVDRLTKSTHFLPIKQNYSMERLARLYIKETSLCMEFQSPSFQTEIRDSLHKFWKSLHRAVGTQLDMSTTYHPQTDCQGASTIQTLEDMLRACVIDFGGSWDKHFPLISSHTTTANTQALSVLHSRHLMVVSVGHPYVRQRSARDRFLVRK
jgi:hypothetical protein